MAVSTRAWARLLAAGFERRYAPGQALLRQGEPGGYVLALLAGRVKVFWTSAEGDDVVLAIRAAGDIIGEMAILGVADRSATAIAIDPCTARVIPADRFRLLMRSPALQNEFLRHAMARLREGEELRAELATLAAGPRLARTILQFVPKGYGPPADVALSQSELGRAAGLSRSTVAAQLARLRKQGVIDTGRGHMVITDLDRLRAAAGETRRNV